MSSANSTAHSSRRLWRGPLACAAIAVLFFAIRAGAETRVTIPDWVRQAAAESLPTYPSDTDAVVILNEETDTVTAPDEHTEHLRRVVKILRPDGRDEGYLFVAVGHQEKLLSIHAWSIDAAGHEYELKEKDFFNASEVSHEEYSDIYVKVAKAPAAAPGTVVGFEYEVRRRDYFNEINWSPQSEIPARHTSLTVQLPSGWELKDYWSGAEPLKPSAAGANGWRWERTNLPGIDDEPHRPALGALAARLTIQLYTSDRRLGVDWAAVSTWAAGLFQVQRTTSPEMTAKVQELIAGKSDFDAKVRAITEFVQKQFRYYAVEIGIGGYQPHPAPEVFAHRYGDCKDKANTLSALLAIAGVNSVPVLIHTHRGVVRPDMPSTYFNHAIIAIELPGGTSSDSYPAAITTKSGKRYIIFDPTDEWMPFGEVRAALQDNYALLVTDSGGELIRVPTLKPDVSKFTRSASLRITPDGAINGKVEEKLTGDFAESLRARVENANQEEKLHAYESQISRSVKNATIQGLAFDGLKDMTKPVGVQFSLTADRYAQSMGPLLIVRPRVLGVKTIGLEKKARKYPLVLGNTALETDDFELEIPDGYAVDDKPDPVSIDTPFASYKSHIEVNGNKLHYSREYVRKSLQIPADKVEDLRAFENKVGADENAAVVLKKVAGAAGK